MWFRMCIWTRRSFAATSMYIINSTFVIPQMMPTSSFMSALNSETNLAREAIEIPYRVGIVSYDPLHYRGGAIRVISENAGDTANNAMYYSTVGLLLYGEMLAANARFDPYNPEAYFRNMSRAMAMRDLAVWFMNFNGMWCKAISTYDVPRCDLSDTVVPITSQAYPGAETLYFADGPIHLEETDLSDDKLFEALTQRVHVLPRP